MRTVFVLHAGILGTIDITIFSADLCNDAQVVVTAQAVFRYTVSQVENLVLVGGEVEGGAPVEVAAADGLRVQDHFPAAVLDIARIDFFAGISDGTDGQVDELVGGIGLVPGDIQTEAAVEETQVEAGFPGLDELVPHVVIVQGALRVHDGVSEVVGPHGVNIVELVGIHVVTYFGIRAAELGEGKPAGTFPVFGQHVGDDPGKGHGRIEVRTVLRGQGRGPVVAQGGIQEYPAAIVDLCAAVEGVHLAVAVALAALRLVGAIVDIEEVGNLERTLAGRKPAVLPVHQVAAEGGGGPKVAEQVIFLGFQEEGEIVLIETAFTDAVGTGVAAGNFVARIELALGLGEIHVRTDADLRTEPVSKVIGQGGVHQETVADVLVGAVLGIPPRVGSHGVLFSEEEHLAVLVDGILEVADIDGNGHGVHLQHVVGVYVGSGDRTVVGLDADVLDLGVEVPFVILTEGGRAAEHHVVAAQGRTGDLAEIFGTGPGGVDPGLSVLLGEGDVLGVGDAGIEEALHVVESLQGGGRTVPLGHCLAGDGRAPAQARDVVILIQRTLAELVLHGGTGKFAGESDRAGHGDAQTGILPSFLGGDQDDAVAGPGAVEGGCGGTLEDGHGLDVLGVDVLQAATHVGRRIPEVVVGGADEVVHRNAVNHDERLVQAREGVVAAEDDAGRSARTVGRTHDGNAGYLARQGVGQVRFTGLQQGVALHVLKGIAQGFLFPRDAEGRDDGSFKHFDVLLQDYIQVPAIPGDSLRDITDAGNDKSVAPVHIRKRERSLCSDRRAVLRSVNKHDGSDDGFACAVFDSTSDGTLGERRHGRRQQRERQGCFQIEFFHK